MHVDIDPISQGRSLWEYIEIIWWGGGDPLPEAT